MKNENSSNISKEELTDIIDGMYLQIVWVWLCIHSLEALQTIPKKELKVAGNFIYITHSSLIYRFTMELAKICNRSENVSIYRLKNLCCQNTSYFDSDFDVLSHCENYFEKIDNYNELIKNIINRRKKMYAHNDQEYYLFAEKAISDFPLDMQSVKELAGLIYNFIEIIQQKIGSSRAYMGYPANPDDVKRLFGQKTETDNWLEGIE